MPGTRAARLQLYAIILSLSSYALVLPVILVSARVLDLLSVEVGKQERMVIYCTAALSLIAVAHLGAVALLALAMRKYRAAGLPVPLPTAAWAVTCGLASVASAAIVVWLLVRPLLG